MKMNRCILSLALALAVCHLPAEAQNKTKKDKKAGTTASAPAGPVDLNSASQGELEALPGVGVATAKKIIAGRPYHSAADLSKAGVPNATIQKITPMVVVRASAPAPSAPAASSAQASAPKTAPSAPKPAPAAAAAPRVAPPSPGMVWVNTETKVFHRQGDRYYGNTKTGKYMSESDAVAAGYRASKQKK